MQKTPPIGKVKVSLLEVQKLRNGLLKKYKGLNINTTKSNYNELADEIKEEVDGFYGNPCTSIGNTFLMKFFTFDDPIRTVMVVNLDAITIYAYGQTWYNWRAENNQIKYYIVAHWSESTNNYRKGIVKIEESNVHLNFDNIYQYEGNVTSSNHTISIQLSDLNAALNYPIFICLYGGTNWQISKHITGVFTTVDLNNFPLSGRVFLINTDEAMTIEELKNYTLPLEAQRYLLKSTIRTELLNIGKTDIIDRLSELAGDYKFFFSGRENSIYELVYENRLTIYPDGLVDNYNPFSSRTYQGQAFIKGDKSLEIISFGHNNNPLSIDSLILIDIGAYGRLATYLPGLQLSFDGKNNPTCFPVLLCSDLSKTKEDEVIIKYFDKFKPIRYSSLTIDDIERIIKETQEIFNKPNYDGQQDTVMSICSYDDVLKWGWSGIDLLDKLIEVDYKTIEGLTEEREGTSEQWSPVFMEHPKMWALLCTKPQNIVGYWHFVPLIESAFERAKQGVLLDSEIVPQVINDIDIPGVYKLYFVSIGIMEEARRLGTRKLMNSLFSELYNLAEEGVFFEDMCACAFTQKGVDLCKGLGMKLITRHESYGNTYLAKVEDFLNSPIFSRYPDLQKIYKNKF